MPDKQAKARKKKGGEKKASPKKGGAARDARRKDASAKEAGGKGANGKSGTRQARPSELPRLWRIYRTEHVPALMKEFNYSNAAQVPRLEKITVNIGLGEAIENIKLIDAAVAELSQITGQKPVVTRARKAVANFKLREGLPIGVMVTLRRYHMYEFLDRLVSVALPRVRDFKGVSGKSFDGRGNYTLGIREQLIFPEINLDKVEKVKGMNISVVTSARTDEEAKALLRCFGMPFRN